ncbi:Eco57I restriction-modification methylase domain-containing protein, partial [Capnocytophaga sputigena]|uniref:Eco57I restriction-modification methylase domain-containing protein n=1 Tax=Capnocytophaga sputigena TaxID=1019 RepID=UPI0028D90169
MENIIHTFKGGNLFETTTALFKHLNISTQTFEEQAFLPEDFLKDLYKPEKHKAINEIYLVGIVTDEAFTAKSLAEVDNELTNDYKGLVVLAVDLKDKIANRTELSTLTRLFNRRFNAMPVAVLFRYGNHIALANAERTQYKQTYREGEKIGKVSILKDIDTLKPHRGHLRILEKLQIDKSIKTFKELYAKWLGVFDTKILNKEFYKELFAWYEWAISETSGIKYPNDPKAIKEERQLEKQIIRLITRVLFVWFIKQKGLVPNNLFEEAELQKILKDFQANSSENGNYYNAILQNLFFATLNKEITERAFAKEKNGRDIKTLYRYAEMFSISEEKVIELFKPVPFLNGGLFECLDKDQGNDGKRYHLDGFSRNENTKEEGNRFRQRTLIPNIFFFEKDKGLFSILNKYYFTVEENTPEEVQVALDPELLGNVFENLLGAFNPETEESARKLSGSFYTPKEVVNYMVDESLKVYLKNHLPSFSSKLIDELFEGQDLTTDFDDITKRKQIAECLRKVKILDPACGSGAFPMGILNRMVYILEKLGVDTNETNYQLKRHLIEKCIYGVDIQTTATQISKLRFFISLILEQSETNIDPALNYGIQPLPNLETKFVTANTLIDIREKKVEVQGDLFESSITTIKEELIKIREAHFEASSPYKKKVLREQDKILREKLIKKLKEFGEATPDNAKQFAEWDPYDQNASATFFDSEWMFGISDGFDIVIGNPPYVQLQKSGGKLAKLYEEQKFNTFARTGDIYSLFYEKAHQLLKQGGICNFITSNKWMRAGYGEATRKFFIENTNPLILIDFAGVKVFETATVDVNILLYVKEKNTFNTLACIVKDKELKELSLYVRQYAQYTQFKNADSWVILSDIEQRIKAKIEAIGTPLKDWDIQINYGIKTGFNDAFIINGEKKAELIAQDSKSAEIIRPILRGRDIKRYGYEFVDLYIITTFPSLKIDIESYPAVKQHLLSFGYDRLKQTGDKGARKKTNNKWFETQDSISYWEDFYKQKIIYP